MKEIAAWLIVLWFTLTTLGMLAHLETSKVIRSPVTGTCVEAGLVVDIGAVRGWEIVVDESYCIEQELGL